MTKEQSGGAASVPSASRSCISAMSPESKSSTSGRTPAGGDHLRHAPDVARRVDDDLAAGVHGVEVEGADVGPERCDMLHPPLGRQQRGAGPGDLGVVLGRDEAPAGAGGEVEDELPVPGPDALHHLAVELERHRGPAAAGLADMDVGHGGAGLGGGQAVRDLLGRDRQVRGLLGPGQVAGDGAGDDDLGGGWRMRSFLLRAPGRHRPG